MTTPDQLNSWLDRYAELQHEIEANGDIASLMVAGVMAGLRGAIAQLAEGDPRGLVAYSEFCCAHAVNFVAERAAQDSEPAN